MRALLSLILIVVIAAPTAAAQRPSTTDWRAVAAALPALAPVIVHTTDGKSMKGTLLSVRDDGIEVQRLTRKPEPARVIPFERVAGLRQYQPGMSSGAKATAGAAATFGAFMFFLIIALAGSD